MKRFIIPVLVIALGVAWLLNVKDVLPGVNWVWTMGLAVTGLILLVIDKINKFNFVVGSFLLIATVFSILRQTGKMSQDIEVPSLFILLGVLMLLVQVLNLQSPGWAVDISKNEQD
jgi:uncharacterized membrane protein YhhN